VVFSIETVRDFYNILCSPVTIVSGQRRLVQKLPEVIRVVSFFLFMQLTSQDLLQLSLHPIWQPRFIKKH
jgi:hypothetical protein